MSKVKTFDLKRRVRTTGILTYERRVRTTGILTYEELSPLKRRFFITISMPDAGMCFREFHEMSH